MSRSSNSQKTPFARSMERWSQQKALDAYSQTGKALPATVTAVSGSIVTVKFDLDTSPWTLPNITVPMVTPQYIRPPIQVGELGGVIPFDALMGNISGLGSASPPSIQLPPSNLGALVWVPVSSNKWSAPFDPNKIELWGPTGFYFRDENSQTTIEGDGQQVTISAPTSLTFKVGGKSIVIDSSGVTIDGILFDTHLHTGVTPGTGNSGGPISA